MAITKSQALTERTFHYGGYVTDYSVYPRRMVVKQCTFEVGPRGGEKLKVTEVRASGACKTWKTRPQAFRLPVKYGLRESNYISDQNADDWHLPEDCPALQAMDAYHASKNPHLAYLDRPLTGFPVEAPLLLRTLIVKRIPGRAEERIEGTSQRGDFDAYVQSLIDDFGFKVSLMRRGYDSSPATEIYQLTRETENGIEAVDAYLFAP